MSQQKIKKLLTYEQVLQIFQKHSLDFRKRIISFLTTKRSQFDFVWKYGSNEDGLIVDEGVVSDILIYIFDRLKYYEEKKTKLYTFVDILIRQGFQNAGLKKLREKSKNVNWEKIEWKI